MEEKGEEKGEEKEEEKGEEEEGNHNNQVQGWEEKMEEEKQLGSTSCLSIISKTHVWESWHIFLSFVIVSQ